MKQIEFVLDASVALSWCFIDEQTLLTQLVLERLEIGTAIVPSIWPLEMANILVLAERKNRITYANMIKFIELLDKLAIKIDSETSYKALHEILLLSRTEKITTYDAAYLELALRLGVPVASKDISLCQVAKRLGVKVL